MIGRREEGQKIEKGISKILDPDNEIVQMQAGPQQIHKRTFCFG